MLQKIIESAGFDPITCARVLGISPQIFQEWAAGQRPVPPSYARELSAALGVDPSLLTKQFKSHIAANITPATWYKFRGPGLTSADRELVLLIRRLGNFINTLEEVTGDRAAGWEQLFEAIQTKVDRQAPPRHQGRQAARIFRESRGLNKGATGIGEVFRGNLRSMGVLVMESPLPESKLEGCTFYVGSHPAERPCVFANTHHLTWFRRNIVLMHELAHAIFDAPNAGASIDLEANPTGVDLVEERADAFALEALIPKEVLRHIAQANGIHWNNLNANQLAMLVAQTQVEKRKLLEVAMENEFISPVELETFVQLDINTLLKQMSERALSTREFIRKIGIEAAGRIGIGKRTTTVSSRSIRLPVPYVQAVVTAFNNRQISRGRAAEMVMIDEDTFTERFGGASDNGDDS